jgi:hypothetical protein
MFAVDFSENVSGVLRNEPLISQAKAAPKTEVIGEPHK